MILAAKYQEMAVAINIVYQSLKISRCSVIAGCYQCTERKKRLNQQVLGDIGANREPLKIYTHKKTCPNWAQYETWKSTIESAWGSDPG